MEPLQDNSLPYVKGKSLCTASFQNKAKPLATVELVCFGSQLFPFLVDPILNMTTRIDMEKAGRKLPNPIFENVIYRQSSSAVIRDKVEYGYCEIRGLEDCDLNIKKTAEFLLQQKWVGVVHMSDSSKLYIVPSSDLSQRLGLTDTSYPHALHGLFARKLPNQDLSVQLSDNLPSKANYKSKKRSNLVFVNLTTDTDDDCKIVEPLSVEKISTSSPKDSSGLSPGDPQPVYEMSHHAVVCASQSAQKKKQKSRTESPLLQGGNTIDQVAKPQYGKSSSKKVKKTRIEAVFTEQACSTPADAQSLSMKPDLQNGSKILMQDISGDTSVCSSSSNNVKLGTSPGILNISSIGGIETSLVGVRDTRSTSSVSGMSVSLIGAGDSQNASSVGMSTVLVGVSESNSPSSVCSTSISLAGVRDPLKSTTACGTSTSSVGDTLVAALNGSTTRDQLATATVSPVACKGSRGGKERGHPSKGAQREADAEGKGKIITRKRGKECLNANSASSSEAEPMVKKKKHTGKPAEDRDGFTSINVLSEVQLKDLVDVMPDIQKLEAEVMFILQEELPMTVTSDSVGTVVSLLSKKPKKSCLSKLRTCPVSQSPSTLTEDTVQPTVSEEVAPVMPSTLQHQTFSEEASPTTVPVMKEVGEAATVEDESTSLLTQLHAETDDPSDSGSLTLKTPKKVSLAEYKSRRRPTLDGTVRGKDCIQTSSTGLDVEKESSSKGIVEILSPVIVGSSRVHLADNPAHHMFNAAHVSTISATIHGAAPSVFTPATVSSRTHPLPSTPIATLVELISSLPQDQLFDGAKRDAGLTIMQQENSEPPIVLSSVPPGPSSIDSIPSSSIPTSFPSVEQTVKLVDSVDLQNSQVVSGSAVPHTEGVSEVQAVSHSEDMSKAGSTVSGSRVGAVSTLVPAVAGMSSDVLTNQYSDYSTPTSSPCPHPQTENLLQGPCPLSPIVPPHCDLSSGSNSSQFKSTDHVQDVNFSATGSLTIATPQEGINMPRKRSISPNDCNFHRYSSTPPALLPVTSEAAIPISLSTPSPSSHSIAEPMLLDPPAELQSPLPLSLVCDSPSFHLMCTSSPQINTSKVDNTIDVSRSPELALELMLSPSSDHPAETTVLAEPQTSSPFSASVSSVSPVLSANASTPVSKDHFTTTVITSESTSLQPTAEWNTCVPPVSSHHGINAGSSSSTRNADKSSPKISAAGIPSAQNCSVSTQNSTGGIYRVPFSVCQPPPISQTPTFYLPTCNYYPYSHHVLPCVPPVSSTLPFVYPWATPYGNLYQHYAVPSTMSLPSPSTQPQAWIVAQNALVSQHPESQPRQQPKSPKLSKGVADGGRHDVLLATEIVPLRTEPASLVGSTIQCKSSHKSTQTDSLLETYDAAAQTHLQCQKVCDMDVGTQTNFGELFSFETSDSVCSSQSDIDKAVWKARQWLIHEIKYDIMETEGDIENSQGSLPSPVISGASNISDGDLMSNSANSDWVSSPSKEDMATSQCPLGDCAYQSPKSAQHCSPNVLDDPPSPSEFQSHIMNSEAYSTPPYTSYSTSPYISYSSPCPSDSTLPCLSHASPPSYPPYSTPPMCPPDSTPPMCPPDSTPPMCPPDSTPPCPPDSTPPPCPPDSTPPTCPPDSTPPCPPDSTPPCPPDSTPPYLPDSTPPCLPDSTPPYLPNSTPPCLSDSTPLHWSSNAPAAQHTSCSTPPYLSYTTPPYLSCSTPPYASYSNSPHNSYPTTPQPPSPSSYPLDPPCPPDSIPSTNPSDCSIYPCLSDSTPSHCLSDSINHTCRPDSTPPHSQSDSTPHCIPDCTSPHCLPYSTPAHCLSDSTPLCGPSDSTPHCLPNSPPLHCPHDSILPESPLNSLPHCPLDQPIVPTFVPSSDSTDVTGDSIPPVHAFIQADLTSVASVPIDTGTCHVTAIDPVNASVGTTSLTSAHSSTHTSTLLGDLCTSRVIRMHSPSHPHTLPSTPVTDIVPSLCKKSSSLVISEWEEKATSLVPCSTGPNESDAPPLYDTLSLKPQSLTKEHITVQQEQLGSFPNGVSHVRAMSLPPLSSRSSNSSGSPNSSSLFEEESVFTFSKKLPGQAASLSSSVGNSFGDPPSLGKPKITMSAAEILQKVRAKRSSQPSLPSLQEQQHEQLLVHPSPVLQEPAQQENEMDATMDSGSKGKGHGIDLDQLMMKFQNHMKTKQKRKKQDKSWRHVSNVDVGSHSLGWYGFNPVLPLMVVPLPNHPFLGCRYDMGPEPALPLLSVENNCKEQLTPILAHNNIDVQPSMDSLEHTRSVRCGEYSGALVSIPCYQEQLVSSCALDNSAPSFQKSQDECATQVAHSQVVIKEVHRVPNTENTIVFPLSLSSQKSTSITGVPSISENPVEATQGISKHIHLCSGDVRQVTTPNIENTTVFPLPLPSQQSPSITGVTLMSENPVEATHGISKHIHLCSDDEQKVTTEGSMQVNEQCFFDLPSSTNQCVSLHLSSSNQHLPFTCNTAEEGEERESRGDEKVITESKAVRDGDDNANHSRGTSLHTAVCNLTMSCEDGLSLSSSDLCGVTYDDYEHVDMITSPVSNNFSSNAASLTCNAGIDKGFSDIHVSLSPPLHEHSCLPSQNHISHHKECVGNERVFPIEIEKAMEAVIVGADDGGARTHVECMEDVEPTALEADNCSSATSTSNVEQFRSAASVSAEQHYDTSNDGVVSEAIASFVTSERTVSSKITPLRIMSPNHEPPQDPTMDSIVGNFRSHEQSSSACGRSTDNFRSRIKDLIEDGSSHLRRERPSNHSRSEKYSPQRDRQKISVWRPPSGQSQNTGRMFEGTRILSQWRDVDENRPAQCSSNSAGNVMLQPLMNLPLLSDSIPQNSRNIATLRGTSFPAYPRALAYIPVTSSTMPRMMHQLQDPNRRDPITINRYQERTNSWQDHPVTPQRLEGSSQLPQPLFSAPHYPPLMEARADWHDSERARRSGLHLPGGRLQRSSYDSGENFSVNNSVDTFGTNINPSDRYRNQGRYPYPRFHKRL